MKNVFVVLIQLVVLFSATANAKVTIKKVTSARTVANSTTFEMATKAFEGFLKCSNDANPDETSCVRLFFSSKVNDSQLRRYQEAKIQATEFTLLFDCDSEKKKMVSLLEESKYDTFYCFESNLTPADGPRVGIVFFVTERAVPKISKIKM